MLSEKHGHEVVFLLPNAARGPAILLAQKIEDVLLARETGVEVAEDNGRGFEVVEDLS